MVTLHDLVTITDKKRTPEGYLDVGCVFARVGIQLYTRGEIGLADGDPNEIVRLYRPPEEVFAADSIASAAMKPVTNDHPPELINSKNIRLYQVGTTHAAVTHDNQVVKGRMLITDEPTIAAVDSGKKEISQGYETVIDWTPGTTPQGEAYDGVQRKIMVNHSAIVDAGRCGGACRINDAKDVKCASCEAKEQSAMTDKPIQTQTVAVDGLSVDATGNGAQIIQKALKDRDDKITGLEKQLADAKAEHEKALAEVTAAKDKAEAERDDAKSKIPDAKALDVLATQRADVITAAKAIAGDSLKTDGLSLAEIQKAAVEAKLGDGAMKDKSADYIAARFDGLKDSSDPIRDAYRAPANSGNSGNSADPGDAYKAMTTGLGDAWKQSADQSKH